VKDCNLSRRRAHFLFFQQCVLLRERLLSFTKKDILLTAKFCFSPR